MESITNVVPTYKSQLSLCSRNEMISACKLFSLPLISFPGKSPKLFPLKAFPSQTGEVQESERLFKKLPPSKWGDHFLSAHVDASVSFFFQYKYIYIYKRDHERYHISYF